MTTSTYDYGGVDGFTLSDSSLYRWLDQQDDDWKELPEDCEFARLDVKPAKTRLAGFRKTIHSIFCKPKPRARGYASQPV